MREIVKRLVYTGDRLREIAFPLGGIGTGTISLGGRGQLRDFEIANRPAKGQAPLTSFFAIGIDDGSNLPRARLLERQFFPPFTGWQGVPFHHLPGLPRFGEVEFTGEYPLAHLEFVDSSFPVAISLDAFNPMIPGHADDSGLPAAMFTWTIENRTDRPVSALLMAVLSNLVGYPFSPQPDDPPWEGGLPLNWGLREPAFRGIAMGSQYDGGRHPSAGTMTIATAWPDTTIQTGWPEGERGFIYSFRSLWYHLLGRVPFEEIEAPALGVSLAHPEMPQRPKATLGMRVRLEPGTSAAIPLVITWCFPNRYVRDRYVHARPGVEAHLRWVGNYYATRFPDAVAVARYVIDEGERLEAETRAFHRHLYATTLPDCVIDAVAANISILRTQTCFRDHSGHFYAYEGCGEDFGNCPMNCTHVWSYEQALASLYPDLERDMRENAFLIETEGSGRMHFRTRTPRTAEPFRPQAPPAADGQMAEIVQLLRDYQLSGDRRFLARLWPKARLALEYAWRSGGWDADRDGVMEGEQHNTSDRDYYGPNPLCTFLYLAALRAAAAIARELGDGDVADTYEALAVQGGRHADEVLWNGDFYQQRLDLAPGKEGSRDEPPVDQLQAGCHVDQLLGQWLANLVELGALVSPPHTRAALRAIYRHNFRSMNDVHSNCLRAFAVNDERGLVLVSYPEEPGEIAPFTALFRTHEVWSGSEYQVACHLIQEGFLDEGCTIVKAIRARHDGSTRNPWSELEAGDHYARAMASYGLLQAYARSHFDLSRGLIALSPQVNQDGFSTFFAVDRAWGSLRLNAERFEIELGAGQLAVRAVVLNGRPVALPGEAVVVPGQPLTVPLRRQSADS